MSFIDLDSDIDVEESNAFKAAIFVQNRSNDPFISVVGVWAATTSILWPDLQKLMFFFGVSRRTRSVEEVNIDLSLYILQMCMEEDSQGWREHFRIRINSMQWLFSSAEQADIYQMIVGKKFFNHGVDK